MFLHFYPAIVTMLSIFFYRRDTPGMQKFYRRMTFSLSARKLFVSLLMLLMLSFNFCYLQGYGVNWALGVGTVLCLSMFSFRITERSIFWLQTRLGIGLGFIAMLTCVVEPAIWPLSVGRTDAATEVAGEFFQIYRLCGQHSYIRILFALTPGGLSFCKVNRRIRLLSKTGRRSRRDFGS